MRYKPSTKIAIVEKVIKGNESVYSVCKKNNISKAAFYKWLTLYKRARKNRFATLTSKIKKGSNHYKSLDFKKKLAILAEVHKNPELSCHDVAKVLGLGHHAVQNVLERENLSRREQREEFSKKSFWKRESQERRLGMLELLEQGWQTETICRHFKISKPTFLKWKRRYQEAREQEKGLALEDRYIAGAKHHRFIGEDVKAKVIHIVTDNPTLSVARIASTLNQQEGKQLIGHHGIQNLLVKSNLNTYEKRLRFSQTVVAQPLPAVVPEYQPTISPARFRMLYAPFLTIPKWVLKTPYSWPIILPLILFFAYIFQLDYLLNPAMFFPVVALTFGFFFFVYSMKYYISIILVTAFSGQEQAGESEYSKTFSVWGIVRKIFHSKGPKALAIHHDMSKIDIERYPFVSIHLPLFNEKRVIDRLIRACSSQEWPNYELVIADDSTDETTEIAKGVLVENGRQLTKTYSNNDMEVYISIPSANDDGPIIKLIHRFSRKGYKGAALANALAITDPKAEFVAVFDADFVPYPDTLEQFVKTFAATCGGLVNIAKSKIAVVQGYQWHVLNKSENWITRGVRTEYAGSYVIERAGIELYGGLNMISGSVFCIRADVLRKFGWQTSITEDFQLTLRLYEAGFKVAFTPFIQAPAEAVSTIRRVIRQRMRWAEGHTFNIKQMFGRLLDSPNMTSREKFEVVYLAPYYLQAFFFMTGTISWFISELVLRVHLPFWTASWGWSLVFVNFLSLPLVNLVGLFLEESDERDYVGVGSFILMSYLLVPFQAYAALKALIEKEEGPWFRTPKTGNITDTFGRVNPYAWLKKYKIFGKAAVEEAGVSVISKFLPKLGNLNKEAVLPVVSSYNPLRGYNVVPRRKIRVTRGVLAGFLIAVLLLNSLAFFTPNAKAVSSTPALEQQLNIMDFATGNLSNTTYGPTDNTLGAVNYDSTKYDGGTTINFEAIAKVSGTDGNTGQGTSIFCTSSTNCNIAYYDASARALKFAHCTTATCASPAPTITVIDGYGCATTGCSTTTDVGQYPSLYCYDATDCSIAYYDATNSALKEYDCTNATCTSSSGGVQTLDSSANVGVGTAITCFVSQTNCMIAYYDATNSALKLLACSPVLGVNCKSNTIYKADGASCTFTNCSTGASVGQYPSISMVVGVGNAYYAMHISYYDSTNGDLKFVKCNSANNGTVDCGGATNVATVESTNDVGKYTSVFCPSETGCDISHYDTTNHSLRFFGCSNSNCSAGTANILDGNTGCTLTGGTTTCSTTANVGQYTSIYCPTSTTCRISYYDVTNADLKVANCTNAACGTGGVESTYTTNDVGSYSSISCISSAACQISHYDATNRDLLFFDCSVTACTNSGGISTKIDAGTAMFEVALFASGSQTPVAGSMLVFTSTSYSRVRTAVAITLSSGTDYTMRYRTDGNTLANIKTGRIIVLQTAATKLTKTEAQVEVGSSSAVAVGGYTDLANTQLKYYCYDGDSTCTAPVTTPCGNSTNKSDAIWNPCPDSNGGTGNATYFEATLVNSVGGASSTSAQLYDITASAAVTGSAITTSSTSYTRVRSSAIKLIAGHQYKVQVSATTNSGTMANAKIILDQNSSSGISATEIVDTYNPEQGSGGTTSYVSILNANNYTSNNYSGTSITRFLDTSMYFTAKSGSTTAFVQLLDSNSTALASVSTTSTTAVFKRASLSQEPANGNVDVQAKIDAGSGTSFTNQTNLVLQLSNMPVPESSIYMLPLILALPFIIRKMRIRSKNLNILEVIGG